MSGGKQTILLAAVDWLKAAPPNPICYSPAGTGMVRPRALRFTASLGPEAAMRSHAASDSLMNDWGCLTNGPERKAFPGNINL